MTSHYDFPSITDKDSTSVTSKPSTFKTTFLPKNKLRRLTRVFKATPSFRLPNALTGERRHKSPPSYHRSVRVSGVDFALVSIPCQNPEGPMIPEADIIDYSLDDYKTPYDTLPRRLKHQLSTHSVIENHMQNITCDSIKLQNLRRKQSLQTQFRQFEEHWSQLEGPNVSLDVILRLFPNVKSQFDEPRRPGSIYETLQMVELEELMKERIFFLTPGDSFISEDNFKFGELL